MATPSKTVHFLVAATFVFVNLLCPCVSVFAVSIAPETEVVAQSEMAPAAADCHSQLSSEQTPSDPVQKACPGCEVLVASGCESQAFAVPVAKPGLTLDPLDDELALSEVVPTVTPVSLVALFLAAGSTKVHEDSWPSPIDTPVRRHDRILV